MVAVRAVERRIVSVCFADLVGFTTLSERLDGEDVAAVQSAYFALVRDVMSRHGGRLEKFIGDAAMAVFGLPRTCEDDAVRAVHAGLALAAGVEGLAGRLRLDAEPLRLRVGISTGEVVVTPSQGEGQDERITGDVVNTASRLQTAAEPGGVLISAATALAVEDHVELGASQQLSLKGKADAVRARVALGVRPSPSREHAMGALAAPLLGREVERASLQAAYGEAQGGRTVLVIVTAEPGAGKSRLLTEFAAWLRSDAPAGRQARVRRAHVDAGAHAALEPVAALLRAAMAGITDAATLTSTLQEAGMAPERAEMVKREVDSLVWPHGSDLKSGMTGSADDRHIRFEAWSDALEMLTGMAVGVDIVEDIHWAGDDLLAWLRARSGRPSLGGQLIVCSTRPLDMDRLATLDIDSSTEQRRARVLELRPLAVTEGRQLIEALVGPVLPDAVMANIVEASRGNPLFIEELLRTWIGAGRLARRAEGGWELTEGHDQVELPLRMATIYAAQLDDLPATPRRAAQLASVAGRHFADALLPALGAPDAAPDLEVLERRALLRSEPLELPALPGHTFRHALLRDAAYATLSRSDRARSHLRAATWLRTFPASLMPGLAGSIAGHYSLALEATPRMASEVGDGLDRGAVAELAAIWYEQAADAATGHGAPGEAARCLARTLELRPDAAVLERVDVIVRLGRALAAAGQLGVARARYAEAASLARGQLADPGPASRSAARNLFGRAVAAIAEADYAELRFADAARETRDALEELGAGEEDVARGWVLLAHAQAVHAVVPGDASAHAELEHALAIGRAAGQRELELEVLRTTTASLGDTGQSVAGDWEAIIGLARELGRTDVVLSAQINQTSYLLDDEALAATRLIAEAMPLAVALGDQERIGWCHNVRVEAGLASGDWDAADVAGRAALRLAEAGGFGRLAVRTWHSLLPIVALRGDSDTVEEAASWFERRAGGFPDSAYGRLLHASARSWFARAGVRPTAVADLGRLLPSFRLDPSGPAWLIGVHRVISDWIDLRDVGAATAARDALAQAIAARAPTRLAVATLALIDARLAGVSGAGTGTAAGHAWAAVAITRQNGAVWWELAALRELIGTRQAQAADAARASQLAAGLGLTPERSA
jgi:class 3 adenylate cyclase